MAALGVLEFTFIWNDYFWALVLTQGDTVKPITVGLDVLRGEAVPTPEQCKYIMSKYKECPMCLALIVLAGHRLPELEEIHEKLKELATA